MICYMINGLKEPLCIPTDFKGFTAEFVILINTSVTVNHFLPCLATFTYIIITLRALKSASDTRSDLGVHNITEVERQTTMCLLLSAFSFIIFTLPEGVFPIIIYFINGDLNVSDMFHLASSALVLFRSGANLLIYFVSSSHFRVSLRLNVIWIASKVKAAFS